jgi:hypothetical protein
MEVEAASSTWLRGEMAELREADDLIGIVQETFESLLQESDLSPANQRATSIIYRLSNRLRRDYISEDVQSVLSNEYVRSNLSHLREMLSRAEFLAELHDARQMLQADRSVWDQINHLSYWNIYVSLVGMELDMLRLLSWQAEDRANSKVVFVGSGPLPLSPILLHRIGGCKVICLDMDAEAYEASGMLIERAGLGHDVKVIQINGSEFDYSGYNRIFLASLVKNKPSVLNQIARSASKPLVAIRTAVGMKQIMYEAVDESLLIEQDWIIQGRTSPHERLVINSTLFLERG